MILLVRLLLLLCCFLQFDCSADDNKNKSKGFYESIAGWDIKHVPLIPPIRATSTYPDVWLLTGFKGSPYGDTPVLSVAVSGCIIFGTIPKGYSDSISKWFIIDTSLMIFEEYETEAQLDDRLSSLKVKKTILRTCEASFAMLASGKRCYWFPPEGSLQYHGCTK